MVICWQNCCQYFTLKFTRFFYSVGFRLFSSIGTPFNSGPMDIVHSYHPLGNPLETLFSLIYVGYMHEVHFLSSSRSFCFSLILWAWYNSTFLVDSCGLWFWSSKDAYRLFISCYFAWRVSPRWPLWLFDGSYIICLCTMLCLKYSLIYFYDYGNKCGKNRSIDWLTDWLID